MATKSMNANNSVWANQIDRRTPSSQKNNPLLRHSLSRLLTTVGEQALAVYRYRHEAEPRFTNGGVRVIFRPGRIDLA